MDQSKAFQGRAAVHRALGDAHRLAVVDVLRRTDRTPGELAEELRLPMNLMAHHLGALEEAGLVVRRRSSGDGRRRYVRLRPDVLVEALGGLPPAATPPPAAERVLFVCSRNAARSQLAAMLWRGRTGRPAESAGSAPAKVVHPLVVAVAGSRGVDLSAARPKGFDGIAEAPDLVVTVCDRALEGGMPFGAVPRLHWSTDDPIADGRPAAFARAYDDLAERIELLAEEVAA